MHNDHRSPHAPGKALQAKESRSHRRLPTNGRGKIAESYDGRETVAFLDVHSHGARLCGLVERAEGASVLFQCGPITRKAKVVWSQKNEFGIAFIERLSQAEVQYLVEVPPETALHYVFDLDDE